MRMTISAIDGWSGVCGVLRSCQRRFGSWTCLAHIIGTYNWGCEKMQGKFNDLGTKKGVATAPPIRPRSHRRSTNGRLPG